MSTISFPVLNRDNRWGNPLGGQPTIHLSKIQQDPVPTNRIFLFLVQALLASLGVVRRQLRVNQMAAQDV